MDGRFLTLNIGQTEPVQDILYLYQLVNMRFIVLSLGEKQEYSKWRVEKGKPLTSQPYLYINACRQVNKFNIFSKLQTIKKLTRITKNDKFNGKCAQLLTLFDWNSYISFWKDLFIRLTCGLGYCCYECKAIFSCLRKLKKLKYSLNYV